MGKRSKVAGDRAGVALEPVPDQAGEALEPVPDQPGVADSGDLAAGSYHTPSGPARW